jgi:hypothetical protein
MVEEESFLEEVERASFLFFWEQANPSTGLIKDRSLANGRDARTIASIAATGFGLSALCVADHRGGRRPGKSRSGCEPRYDILQKLLLTNTVSSITSWT